ncbi:hypothetical protein H0H87_012236 [Tephrocybe sp. NHM501043]|nr:hypothetical protein H0H87_012236 [Tephrocybe sp. NHM501043]
MNRCLFHSHDIIFEEGCPHRTLNPINEELELNIIPEEYNIFDLVDSEDEQAELQEGVVPAWAQALILMIAEAVPDAHLMPLPPLPPSPPPPQHSDHTRIPSTAAPNAAQTEADVLAAAEQGLDWAQGNKNPTSIAFSASMLNIDKWVPNSYSEATTRPNLWKGPMDENMGQMEEAKQAVKELGKSFKIKDLSNIQFVLGIRIICNCKTNLLMIDQEEYIKHSLKKHGMSDCKTEIHPTACWSHSVSLPVTIDPR